MSFLKKEKNNVCIDDQHHHSLVGSFKDYMTGFFFSLVLTVIPFWLVMCNVFQSRLLTVSIVFLLGAIQIIVHLIYFLHMNSKLEDAWNMAAMVFTLTIIVICFVGSLWVMHHLNENMMPMCH